MSSSSGGRGLDVSNGDFRKRRDLAVLALPLLWSFFPRELTDFIPQVMEGLRLSAS